MSTHDFEYECAGTTARGLLALPEVREGEEELAPPYPGVVVCHAWKGPGSFERERAEELAEMGFAVLVADVYGGQRANDNDEAAALSGALADLLSDGKTWRQCRNAVLEAYPVQKRQLRERFAEVMAGVRDYTAAELDAELPELMGTVEALGMGSVVATGPEALLERLRQGR